MNSEDVCIHVCVCEQYGMKHAGGVEHVPVGWDEWHGLVS